MEKNKGTAAATGGNNDATGAAEAGNATLEKIGREALKRNPSMSVVYVTSDGTAFGSSSDAENHAKTLGDTTIEIVTE